VLEEAGIALEDDGQVHRVRVVMGEPPTPSAQDVDERTLSSRG